MIKPFLLLFVSIVAFPRHGWALGQERYVVSEHQPGDFPLFHDNAAATIYVDAADYPGVIRATSDLQADIGRVTGITPRLTHAVERAGNKVAIVGTLGKSRLIDALVGGGRLDASSLAGKWETFVVEVVREPFPGIAEALVIAGSDKRGTIFGVYDLSEQIGVSPWHWWADVPVRHQKALWVRSGRHLQGPPGVKYRGIFLNDEAPSLTGWVHEKFGDYNHCFYTNVFQLLLRLKANYLWPAMWNNCFNEDDPLNPKLADEYGIVMGTSHVEPMLRADKEWNRKGYTPARWNYATNPRELAAFWEEGLRRNRGYESLITIGMRGKIDTPMSETANIALLEKIVADQRQIIERVAQTNAAAVSQVWALYKEVQEYYEKGMRVPDDVTLLWCDDNWGNLRRLPTPEERGRSGGAGIYYHFDYVGGPRSYKWLNTVPISKVWEQMNLAYQYKADRIWIVNVGDLKPMEFPMEFFLSMAWEPTRWSGQNLREYARLWAEREFGPGHAEEIAALVSTYTKYNGRRKPELLEPTTFSLVDYLEADQIQSDWQTLAQEAETLSRALPPEARDAFFELVLYPVKACAVVNELYITVGKNRMCAAQGRAGANRLAAHARDLFTQDSDLAFEFNQRLAGGKWAHMMDQTHIGYTDWQQPPSNAIPQVMRVRLPARPDFGVAVEGSTAAWPGAPSQPKLPCFDRFNQPRRYIDVFSRGAVPIRFSVTPSASWIRLSKTSGQLETEQRIWVSIDWRKAPRGRTEGSVTIMGPAAAPVTVAVECSNPVSPAPHAFQGFVEADGYISIEAEHFTRNSPAGASRWEKVDDLGRTLSAMTVFPVTAVSASPPDNAACLEYQLYLFHSGELKVEAILSPSLGFVPGRGLRFAVSFDDQPPKVIDMLEHNAVPDWEQAVKDSVRMIPSYHRLDNPGSHTLKFWAVDPGVVLQKLVVDCGGLKPSYLGPPESFRNS